MMPIWHRSNIASSRISGKQTLIRSEGEGIPRSFRARDAGNACIPRLVEMVVKSVKSEQVFGPRVSSTTIHRLRNRFTSGTLAWNVVNTPVLAT
jgi:hypothetical protein